MKDKQNHNMKKFISWSNNPNHQNTNGTEESNITTALNLVYKLSLLFEASREGYKVKSATSSLHKSNQMDLLNSNLVTVLRFVYRLSALLEEKMRGALLYPQV